MLVDMSPYTSNSEHISVPVCHIMPNMCRFQWHRCQEQRDIYLEMRKLRPSEPVEESLAILLKSAVAEDSDSSVNWAPWWWSPRLTIDHPP